MSRTEAATEISLGDVIAEPDPFDLAEVLERAFRIEDGGGDSAVDVIERETSAFKVDSKRSAEWAMAHWARARAVVDEHERLAKEYKARIVAWEKANTREARATLALMGGYLEGYARAVRDVSEEQQKFVDLPSGRVSTASQPAAVIVDNVDVLLKWMADHITPELLDTIAPRSVGLTKLRELVTLVEEPRIVECPECGGNGCATCADTGDATVQVLVARSLDGEEPDGVRVEPARVTVSIKAK